MRSGKIDVKKLFDLSGRVVVLTGASGLLGTQYAIGLSQAGANVVLADIDYNRCNQLARDLQKKYGVDPLPVRVDITSKQSIKKMIAQTIKKFSKIDVLVNNAVYPESKKERLVAFDKFPLLSWNKALAVNITGMFLSCQEVSRIMLRQKNGVIINVSSIYGLVAADQRIYGNSGLNSSVVYAVTKSAVLNLTRYLASYWQKTGIRVNTLSLGGVENKQSPDFIKNYSYKTMIGRMARKDEYVGALLFLASDASSYMTGANLIVDGGWTAW